MKNASAYEIQAWPYKTLKSVNFFEYILFSCFLSFDNHHADSEL